MVPNHVLQKADADLQALRMSAFKLLQPKLQCKLGKITHWRPIMQQPHQNEKSLSELITDLLKHGNSTAVNYRCRFSHS